MFYQIVTDDQLYKISFDPALENLKNQQDRSSLVIKILDGIIVQHPIAIDLRGFERFVPVLLSRLILAFV